MAKKKMPSVIVTFKEKGISAIERSERGILCMILEDTTADIAGSYTIYSVDDIPEKMTDENKEQVKLALMGYQTSPRKVLVYIVKAKDSAVDYTEILKTLENVRFDWLVVPQITTEKTADIVSWIKSMRTKDKMVKAVLPNVKGDTEGIVNFTNKVIKTAAKSYTTAEYCSRVAGIICGTPMIISCTYAPAPELVEVDNFTSDEMDEKVGNGEFFFFNDGEKIKVARGINSLVTTMQGKGEDFQKIKLVDLLDMIHDDITKTGHDSYIGKYANSYDNRALLVTAINGYLHTLETEGLLEKGQNVASIDLTATKNWLESNGKYTRDELENMDEKALKEANIHDNVFIHVELSPLDAIENITVNCAVA